MQSREEYQISMQRAASLLLGGHGTTRLLVSAYLNCWVIVTESVTFLNFKRT